MRLLRSCWFLLLLVGLVSGLLAGCGGGGGNSGTGVGPVAQTPEDAVRALVADWQQTGGPTLILAQTGTTATTTTSTATATTSLGQVRFRDFFSDETWELSVDRVEYLSAEEAYIYTSYLYRDLAVGQSIIRFRLVRNNGLWELQDISVESLPAAVVSATGIQGFVIDKVTRQAVSGAEVHLWRAAAEVASTVTDLQGYYRFTGLTAGTYEIVIVRLGYRPETISGITVQ
ncbi:MAG: carboxypeptidase regulatory-like domain-containing protein [Candidatus Riflebacteria bacterium]|nr:carboxypeptidase regulatory-like domain-containing protein [Candidatus Riflebacteria bacterium]